MRKLSLALIGVLIAVPLSSTVSQETTASGNLNTEASWAALHNLIDVANSQSKMAMALAEAIKSCGSKGMVYGPGIEGADTNGCLPQSSGTDVMVRGKATDKPLIQAGFAPRVSKIKTSGKDKEFYTFPKPFKTGTVPVVVLNRNFTPGGDDTDNFACDVTNLGFWVCGDAKDWYGASGETTADTVRGRKWIAVGEAP
jgi:hypothetical protein